MSKHIKIFDTTLRDGEQSPGCSMNKEEKLEVALQLERLNVDIIEAGFAISSKGDFESISLIAQRVRGPVICSLARAVRQDIEDVGDAPYFLPLGNEPLIITVLGGSQGASLFSRIIPEALALVDAEVRTRIALIHQAPAADVTDLTDAYAALGVPATVETFVRDMAATYTRTHMLISRAGAATLGEIIATARPAILVPYAQAADNHQHENARILEDAHAALVISEPDFTPQILADNLNKVFHNKEILLQYSKGLRTLRHPGAAARIVNFLRNPQHGQ
jgi:UDP-N-acetylglucosamine--N-acetylmuramyl-(pentapeptide) pyrophosphoryl-undecaprenol N-acetylglucosamine transferase